MRNLTPSQRIALGLPTTTPNFQEVRRSVLDFKSGQIIHAVDSGPLPDGQRELIGHSLIFETDQHAIYAARIQVKLDDKNDDIELNENLDMVTNALIEDAALMKSKDTTEYATEAIGLLGKSVDGQTRQIGNDWALITIVIDKTTGEYQTSVALWGSVELIENNILAIGDDKKVSLASMVEFYDYLTVEDAFQAFDDMLKERGSVTEFNETVFLTRGSNGKVMISNGQNTQLFRPVDIGDGCYRLEPAARASGIVLAYQTDDDKVILLDGLIDSADPNQVTTHTVSPVDMLGDDFAAAYRKHHQATETTKSAMR